MQSCPFDIFQPIVTTVVNILTMEKDLVQECVLRALVM